MVVVAKDPTQTVTIVSGWYYPEKAHALDGLYTEGKVINAKQEYLGYGFDIPFGAKIRRVKVKSRLYGSDIDVIVDVKIYDGTTFYTKRIDKYSTPQIPLTPTLVELDFTDVTNWTAGKVNNIRTRIVYSAYLPATAYVDNLTVEVEYTTVEEVEEAVQETITQFIQANWLPLSILGIIIAIVIAIILWVW